MISQEQKQNYTASEKDERLKEGIHEVSREKLKRRGRIKGYRFVKARAAATAENAAE